MSVMESREAIDDAETVADVDAVVDAARADAALAWAALREAFAAGDLEGAAERVVELNFYGKIDAEAAAKVEALRAPS